MYKIKTISTKILIFTATVLLILTNNSFAKPTHNGVIKTFGPAKDQHAHKTVNPDQIKLIKDISRNAAQLPAPLNRSHQQTIKILLKASEVKAEIAPGINYNYWTFNNTVPGPFLRIRVGDTVELTLHNNEHSSHNHSIDLHAVTGPGGGATLTDVEPGESKSFRFKALSPGLFTYHCATPNAPTHIANGMSGLILVEPKKGLVPVDKEFYLLQSELYTQGPLGETGFQAFDKPKMLSEAPEYIVFNGRTGALSGSGELTANVGDKIRIFFGNGGVSKISSFHIIGEIFDKVYPEAATNLSLKNIQTTVIPAGGATIVELQVDVPGDYILVDHALARIDRGAWGVLKVIGKPDETIFSSTTNHKISKNKKSH